MTVDLLVLGAGPAGVGAAYRAATASRSVMVIERSDRVGGASASFEVSGQRVDLGSHRLHPSTDPGILRHIDRALEGSLQRRSRNGRIRLAGRWIAFPLKTADLLTHLPPGFGARAAFDAATRFRRSAQRDTFAELLRAGLGPTMCERFYFPYARKLWGLEPDDISGEQARRRVAASSPTKMLKRLLPGRGSEGAHFYYPRDGFGAIVESLAALCHQRRRRLPLRCGRNRGRAPRRHGRGGAGIRRDGRGQAIVVDHPSDGSCSPGHTCRAE